jgi:hypothetical protein
MISITSNIMVLGILKMKGDGLCDRGHVDEKQSCFESKYYLMPH